MPTTVLTSTFSGYTLGEARAKVLRKLRVNDTTRYSPTDGSTDYDWVDDALNVAQRDFVTRTKCLRTYAIMQIKNGYRTYRAPKGFIDIAAAYFFSGDYEAGYKNLAIRSVAEMNNEYSDWRTDTDEEIDAIYIDRFFGTDAVLGVYPIPTTDGATTFFASDTGTQYDWACPLYAYSHDYGIVLKTDGTDKYILADSDEGVVADMDVGNGNILLEYYRLPMDMSDEDQLMETPYAYQETVIADAAKILLEDNPEDSVEFKRSQILEGKVDKSIVEYKRDTKVPMSGRQLRARTAIEGWVKDMDWRKGMF